MFEFVSLLEKTRERAIFMKRQAAAEEEDEGLRESENTSNLLLSLTSPLQRHTLPQQNQALFLWLAVSPSRILLVTISDLLCVYLFFV